MIELTALQKKSKSGVITLNAAAFEHFVGGASRPYSLFVVADSRQFRKQGKLKLEEVVNSYAAVARAFAAEHAGTPAAGAAFFARIIFEDAREAFGRLGVRSLPYLAHVAPTLSVKAGVPLPLPGADVLKSGGGPWSALDVAAFVGDRTGLSPGDVVAESETPRSRFLPLITLGVVAALCAAGWRLYQAPLMHFAPLYAAGSLLVYWFAVSGGMYNIIRGAPFVGFDRATGRGELFTTGSGQLGAEGAIMGTAYVAMGLSVAALTRVVPRLRDEAARLRVGLALLGVAGASMWWVLGGHAWKTGMRSYFLW